MGALADEPHVSALLVAHGFAEVRRYWLMRIEFDGPPARPAPVPGIDIRPLEHGQEVAVYRCMIEAFRDHWGVEEMPEADWIHRHVDAADQFHPHLWLLAWERDRLAGALIALPRSVQEPAWGTSTSSACGASSAVAGSARPCCGRSSCASTKAAATARCCTSTATR